MTSTPSRASIPAATVSNAVGRIDGYQFTPPGHVIFIIRPLSAERSPRIRRSKAGTSNREWMERRTFDLLILKIVAFLPNLTLPSRSVLFRDFFASDHNC